jgi:hypothetical protein
MLNAATKTEIGRSFLVALCWSAPVTSKCNGIVWLLALLAALLVQLLDSIFGRPFGGDFLTKYFASVLRRHLPQDSLAVVNLNRCRRLRLAAFGRKRFVEILARLSAGAGSAMALTLQLLCSLTRADIRRHTLEMKFRHCARGGIGRCSFQAADVLADQFKRVPQVHGPPRPIFNLGLPDCRLWYALKPVTLADVTDVGINDLIGLRVQGV